MPKTTHKPETTSTDDMRPEYDFRGGVRGKHARAMQNGYTVTIHNPDGTTTFQEIQPRQNTIFLEPDVAAYFPDSAAVNNALRTLINLVPKPRKSRVHKTPLVPASKG